MPECFLHSLGTIRTVVLKVLKKKKKTRVHSRKQETGTSKMCTNCLDDQLAGLFVFVLVEQEEFEPVKASFTYCCDIFEELAGVSNPGHRQQRRTGSQGSSYEVRILHSHVGAKHPSVTVVGKGEKEGRVRFCVDDKSQKAG